jgi:hypothetical protein
LVSYLLLILSVYAYGRQLSCTYATVSPYGLWPQFNKCSLASIDLSGAYKTVDHTFTGTPAEKSAVTVVEFTGPFNIDFLPRQVLSNFANLNGLVFNDSPGWPVVRNDFFPKEFSVIQYLHLAVNKIETIEADAFQHLTKLKWIGLGGNLLKSLPFQLFRNNPDLIVIWLNSYNQVNSVTPDFFKNLNKLHYVNFSGNNRCINKVFGCESVSCSVSRFELDASFSTCYSNCLSDGECAAKSGKLDNLSQEEIEKNLGLIIRGISNKFEEMSKGMKVQHDTIESLGNNLTLLIETHDSELKSLKQEVANLERKLSKLFKKEFDEFVTKLNEGA